MTRPKPTRRYAVESPPTAEDIEDNDLDDDEADDDRNELDRLRHHHAEIDRHADGDEEYGKQQAFERGDIGLDLMAIFGIRQAARRR